jgi:TolB-like protein
MSGILQGYEYEIFISYRNKDNEYDGWVTEFVNNLRRELHATLKEEISIYFDENPTDGLLETHIVDKSIENKLKCLIFIPIISQTYCDPKCYAWQNEFLLFNNLTKEDTFGREIKLFSGNVASRILPVKIHDLDPGDKLLLENELGSVLRSIDFIFKSPGVNRPLKPDDSRTENLNHTYYRDQINKVANAVKEIITALKFQDVGQVNHTGQKLNIKDKSWHKRPKKLSLKIAIWSFLILVLAVSSYLLLPVLSKTSNDNVDKSIAVLPFENLSNDPDQDYFGDGIMQEILNHLFKIGGLKIPSSTSSMRYKNSKLSVKEIAGELNVSYVLEGNVSRSGDNVRIIVRMISGKDERLIWTEDYNKLMTATNLLEIQSEVAQQVAENMKVVINPEVKKRIEAKPTSNTEAYNLLLRARGESYDKAMPLLEKAIILDPGFAEAYADLAYNWVVRGLFDEELDRKHILQKAEPLVNKALQLDTISAFPHAILGQIRLWHYWDFPSVEKEYRTFKRIAPSNSDLNNWFTDYLLAAGRFKEALDGTKNDFDQGSNSPGNYTFLAFCYYYNEKHDLATITFDHALRLFPENKFVSDGAIRVNVYTANYKKALKIFENSYPNYQIQELSTNSLGVAGIAYNKTGDLSISSSFLDELLSKSRKSPAGSPSFYAAAIYTAIGENQSAIQLLEKAFSDREVEMYWLNVEPLFKPLHGDPRFENILQKIGFR